MNIIINGIFKENGEPEFFQNHALWKQFGAEKVHILVKETIETIHQSQNPRLCLHIGIDGIGLFDSVSFKFNTVNVFNFFDTCKRSLFVGFRLECRIVHGTALKVTPWCREGLLYARL